MNAYDFDNTIYCGDSSWDFFCFSLRRRGVLIHSLKLLPTVIAFLLRKINKTMFKQQFFGFLLLLPDVNKDVETFWDTHIERIKPFYLNTKRTDDLILSASPEFLLRPVLSRLGLPEECLIGSRVDPVTGHFEGRNCFGEEKLIRLSAEHPESLHQIDAFYSDSLSDAPLASIAKCAFFVRGEKLLPWPISGGHCK